MNGLAPSSFLGFILKHLRHHTPKPIRDFHQELASLIQYQRVAVAAPRSFAKSTYFSLFYPLYAALERPGTNILLISATGALAETWLAKIRKELELNSSILRYYGSQNETGKWAIDELHLTNGSIIMAKGAEKQIRGFRPDIIVCDDLETDEMVLSVDRRKKFDHWFWTDVVGTLRPEGQLLVIGTLLHPESFLADLVHKGRHNWITKFYAAIRPDGAALWPDAWSLAKLDDRRKEMGTYEFEQEYMNNPLPDDLRKFQKKWISYFDKEPSGCVYFTMVDPAIEVNNPNDFTAIVTCAVTPDLDIYVVEALNKKLLPKETIDAVFDTYNRWRPATIGIETVGFQKMLKYEIQQERNRRGVYPVIVELKSGGRRKGLRIEALQPRFEMGKIHIKKNMDELELQLLRFPSPRCHDDLIDALAYLLDIIRPATKHTAPLNPNSFIAQIEQKRAASTARLDDHWGNHNLREVS